MKGKENILLVGGGGHCKACIDVIEQQDRYNIIGIIDRKDKIGETVLGYPVVDVDTNIEKWRKKSKNILITIGHIKSPELRIKLYIQAINSGFSLPVIISPNAYVSKYSTIGEGTIIMHGIVVNASASVGKNCIINNQALIEHDVVIGNHTHISTGVKINGEVAIGNNCFVGSGTVINHGINIVNDVVIGSGSLVRKEIEKPGIYAGNPLKSYR